MLRCRNCLIPDTRPDTAFENGVCSACLSYEKRWGIDWDWRRSDLFDLIIRHRKPTKSPWDCIVASSGGKDSHYITNTLIQMGVKPLLVTATTCHLTRVGKENIANLARYATTWESTPNRHIRALLNRLGLQFVGDISWPEHITIFTTPFRIAAATGVSLIFYGENPQNQYGGPPGEDEAKQLTRRWRSEFGGFLGMRPSDMVGHLGISARDMMDYEMPSEEEVEQAGIEAHFLGQYVPWDSHENAEVAKDMGMIQVRPCAANVWNHENLDNAQTAIHDHMMYRKYGYGRACAQLSVDIRAGRRTRQEAYEILKRSDGLYPHVNMGLTIEDILKPLNMGQNEFEALLDQFTNWDLFRGTVDKRPILKEFA